jgi:hypothetical protein
MSLKPPKGEGGNATPRCATPERSQGIHNTYRGSKDGRTGDRSADEEKGTPEGANIVRRTQSEVADPGALTTCTHTEGDRAHVYRRSRVDCTVMYR